MESIIQIQNLKKYYGKGENLIRALDGIDLEIEKGKFTAVIGTSGSGKTTLFNMIGGIDVPTEGRILVDQVELNGMKEKQLAVFRRNKIGFIYQDFNLISTLNVKENILFPLEIGNLKPDWEFFEELVCVLGIQEKLNAYPGELSGGGRQRAAIARALLGKPAVVLADEPTGNLDSKTSEDVIGLLKMSSKQFSQTIVMITHNPQIAELADRVIRIEDGRIVSA